jgi:hypothetical protein
MEMVQVTQEMCFEHKLETVFSLSRGDVTSGF